MSDDDLSEPSLEDTEISGEQQLEEEKASEPTGTGQGTFTAMFGPFEELYAVSSDPTQRDVVDALAKEVGLGGGLTLGQVEKRYAEIFKESEKRFAGHCIRVFFNLLEDFRPVDIDGTHRRAFGEFAKVYDVKGYDTQPPAKPKKPKPKEVQRDPSRVKPMKALSLNDEFYKQLPTYQADGPRDLFTLKGIILQADWIGLRDIPFYEFGILDDEGRPTDDGEGPQFTKEELVKKWLGENFDAFANQYIEVLQLPEHLRARRQPPCKYRHRLRLGMWR